MRIGIRINDKSTSDLVLFTPYETSHKLTREEAYELGRGLIVCADLLEELEKRDPMTGKFRRVEP